MSYISEKYKIPSETVMRMAKDGIIDWRVNYLHEFYLFYNEILEGYENNGSYAPKTDAREEMMLHYKLSERNFYKWINRCKVLFAPERAIINEL